MLKYLFIGLLCVLPVLVRAQIISGTVYRFGSDNPIASASVYYGGSITGTTTNDKGSFQLTQGQNKIPFIVSCVGFYSEVVNDYTPGQTLKIYLKPKVKVLRAVTIGKDGMSREDEEKLFKQEFLGVSPYGLSCNITNMSDIDLAYNKQTKTLTAYCENAIEIDNKKLGYHLSYYLDRFIRNPHDIVFAGNFIFKDNMDATKAEKTKHNREDAYEGSRMQLIRALWANNLDKTRFKIYSPDYDQLDADSIVNTDKLGEKFIDLKYKIIIVHNNEYPLATHLTQTRAHSFISQNGFYNLGLRWFGTMGTQRVGDMLPFEYKSDKEINDSLFVADSIKFNPNAILAARKIKNDSLMGIMGKKAFNDLSLFKSIVLTPNNMIDKRLTVKKWHLPIRYKIYGTFTKGPENYYIVRQTIAFFKQLSALTGLDIRQTDVDSAVNFSIFAGSINNFKDLIPREAIPYLKQTENTSSMYYFADVNGISNMIQVIRPAGRIWLTVQKQIIKGMGFLGSESKYENSVFFDGLIAISEHIQASDARIIKTFYNPDIKSGMTEAQLDEVITRVFANGAKATK